MGQTIVESEIRFPVFATEIPDTVLREGRYEVRFAHTLAELDAVLRLRYLVFNLELGEGLEESHQTGRDEDPFDAVCHHLIVLERRSGEVVGTYRMQTAEMAAQYRGFYSAQEFDLSQLPAAIIDASFEVGRACVAEKHRNTQVLFLLWKGMAVYVQASAKRFLFGCCSLTSQDPVEGRAVLAYLDRKGHLHPDLEVRPQPGWECYDDQLQPDPKFRVKIPKLFRIYLRHHAKICGPPAIDRAFKTIDYLVIFDVEAMDRRQIRTFFG